MRANSSCILKNLDNPLLNGIALGLEMSKEGRLAVSQDFFPCCKGESYAWHADTRSIERCSLHPRLHRLQGIIDKFKLAWPNAARLPHQIPPAYGQQILEEIASVIRFDRPQATVNFHAQKEQASLLWPKAFAAAWRYGLDARIVRWGNLSAEELVGLTKSSTLPVLIFLEHVDRLWDPQNAENFEFLIQQAYNAGYPIWVDFFVDADARALDDSLKGQFARRIKKGKPHPLDSLSEDCLSRLRSISGLSLKS